MQNKEIVVNQDKMEPTKVKPIHVAVALVIYNPERTKVLSVQRPENDPHLPNIWGLPATNLNEGETFDEAIIRAAKQKLGVEVKIIKEIGEGSLDRPGYTLQLKDFEVEVVLGEPVVPQPFTGITQYQAWKWIHHKQFIDAAKKGSLSSRIYLNYIGEKYNK